MVARSRFLLALRGLFEYAAEGGDLSAALTSNRALDQMMNAWQGAHQGRLTLAEALEAAAMLDHMLRPLSAPPVRCDVVHSSMNGLSMLVAMAAKWRYGTPVVMSEHGIYLRERYLAYLKDKAAHAVKVLVLGFFRALAGGGYLIADAIAAHSFYNRRWQLHNGADPGRMWTMYNGVSPEDFPVAQSEPAVPTIVFMGRIDPIKDIHTLIRAFATVRMRIPEAKLRIFGTTPLGGEAYASSCRRLIADLELTDAATLEGAVSSPVEAYHAATVVALTSISEGFPYSVIEAMACGRPLVCTNVGGVAEAVSDGGFVVTPRDYNGVAQACLRLLDDAELRQQMAVAARSRVMDMFTLAHSLEAYREVYAGITGLSPSPSQSPAPIEQSHRRPRAQGRVRIAAGERG